jgi:hypothetical protein
MRVLQAEQRARSQSQLATGMFSYQAMAWPHEGQRERGVDRVTAGAFLLPAALQHQREAVDDDVQEAADAQPEQGQDEGRKQDFGDGHRLKPPGPA